MKKYSEGNMHNILVNEKIYVPMCAPALTLSECENYEISKDITIPQREKMSRAMDRILHLEDQALVERFPWFLSILRTADMGDLVTKLEQATGKEICSYILSCLIVL